MIFEDIEYADEFLEGEGDLRDMFNEIARYHMERRKHHDRDGFFARDAYGSECLALGHVEPEVPEGEEFYDPYSDDELYLDGTHITGWEGDFLCTDTRYGWACMYCKSEDCDHGDTGAILWDMLSEDRAETGHQIDLSADVGVTDG